MASENDWKKNCDKAEKLVRDAARQGAQLILLQELFDGDYFCIEQHTRFFKNAHEIEHHPTVARFAALAKELGVVLPISVFERAGQAHYNTTVMADADGKRLGIYRKSHIPRRARLSGSFISRRAIRASRSGTRRRQGGARHLLHQWFPNARAMALMGGGDFALSTAIGSEPPSTRLAATGRTPCGAMWRPHHAVGCFNRVGRRRPMGGPTFSMAGPSRRLPGRKVNRDGPRRRRVRLEF